MIKVTVDDREVRQAISNLPRANKWIPEGVSRELPALGKKVNFMMRDQISRSTRRYTGVLEDSVVDEYNKSTMEESIHPTAMRGTHDAGLIAQLGTRPIPNVPWAPIKAWGLSRPGGILTALAAMKSIREHGVKPHPFLLETMNRADFAAALEDAANKLGVRLAAQVWAGDKPIGYAETG